MCGQGRMGDPAKPLLQTICLDHPTLLQATRSSFVVFHSRKYYRLASSCIFFLSFFHFFIPFRSLRIAALIYIGTVLTPWFWSPDSCLSYLPSPKPCLEPLSLVGGLQYSSTLYLLPNLQGCCYRCGTLQCV